MPSEVIAAVVAGAVSLIVALATALHERRVQQEQFDSERQHQQAEFRAAEDRQRKEFDRERERQHVELRRRMTDRLYERRIAVYPYLFAATAMFRRSVMKSAQNLRQHLRDAIDDVNAWHAGEGGLLLSGPAHRALLDLRHAVKAITEHDLEVGKLDKSTESVWDCKNKLRAAMRNDIVLLFEESEKSGVERPLD
jgi:hypothetical protein